MTTFAKIAIKIGGLDIYMKSEIFAAFTYHYGAGQPPSISQ